MRKALLPVAAVLAVGMFVSSNAVASTRSEVKSYSPGAVANTGPIVGGLVNDCSGTGSSYGGTCFTVEADDATVDVSIADTYVAGAIGGVIQFTDDQIVATQVGAVTHFCGSVTGVAVPAGAKEMYVSTTVDEGLLGTCGVFGSTGLITADFTAVDNGR